MYLAAFAEKPGNQPQYTYSTYGPRLIMLKPCMPPPCLDKLLLKRGSDFCIYDSLISVWFLNFCMILCVLLRSNVTWWQIMGAEIWLKSSVGTYWTPPPRFDYNALNGNKTKWRHHGNPAIWNLQYTKISTFPSCNLWMTRSVTWNSVGDTFKTLPASVLLHSFEWEQNKMAAS